MNKRVLVAFVGVVGFVLGVVPVVGYLNQHRGGVEASSLVEGAAFVWSADNLPGTAWTYTHRVPVTANFVEVGWLDVDLTLDFLPGQRVKLTSVAFLHGQPTAQGAELQRKLTASDEASYIIRSRGRLETSLQNPLAALNSGKRGQYSRNLELRIDEDVLYLVGVQAEGKNSEVPLRRFH